MLPHLWKACLTTFFHKEIKTDWIYPYIQNLLFDFLLKQIEDINYETIKFEFWDYSKTVKSIDDQGNNPDPAANKSKTMKEPRKDVFEKFFEKQYFTLISQMLKRYFQKSFLDLIEDEREAFE